MQPITPCLWFDNCAEEAVNYYLSVFKNARITQVVHYDKESAAVSGQREGSVLTVTYELNGQSFLALKGGPRFKLNEAVSFIVHCDTQDDIDHYWEKLGAGGEPVAQQCGWLKDKFGVSWQIVPAELPAFLSWHECKQGDTGLAANEQARHRGVAARSWWLTVVYSIHKETSR